MSNFDNFIKLEKLLHVKKILKFIILHHVPNKDTT